MDIFSELKKDFPRIESDVMLKDYTTFRIGGPAKYFLRTSDKKELKKVLEKAISLKINFYVMGGGSNLLFSSEGFDGLVIVFKVENLYRESFAIDKKEIEGESFITVDTTIPLSSLIMELKNYSGLEWAAGIPGTLGGAINGNAGAFGTSIADCIETVDVLEIDGADVIEKTFKKKDCLFAYRSSAFKNNPSIIAVSARLKLVRSTNEEVMAVVKDYISKRSKKNPKGFSAGSVFKNYFGKLDGSVLKDHSEFLEFNEKGIIPAGLLIESCGLKGKIIGGAKISEEHANFILNFENASSDDVIGLINLVKKSVKEKFLIDLREEIQIF